MRIGIVNDLPLAVEALRRAIALKPQHRILWAAHNGAEAVACCMKETPDLVLMDLIMPGCFKGFENQRTWPRRVRFGTD